MKPGGLHGRGLGPGGSSLLAIACRDGLSRYPHITGLPCIVFPEERALHPARFLQFAWKDSPFLPCGLDSRYPPTPEPLKAVPRRVAQPRVQRAGTAQLPGCGQALPLPPALCGCGPGAGNTPPFGRGRGGLEARFHPSPVWERAEKSTAKLSAGSPEGLPVCRLVSNAQMP